MFDKGGILVFDHVDYVREFLLHAFELDFGNFMPVFYVMFDSFFISLIKPASKHLERLVWDHLCRHIQ